MPERLIAVRVVNLRNLVFWALGIYVLYQFIEAVAVTLVIFAIAFFFAIVLDPAIRWLDRRGLRRGTAVGLMALAVLGSLALALYVAIPSLVHEGQDLARNAPEYAKGLETRLDELLVNYPSLREQIAAIDLQKRLTEIGPGLLPRLGRFSLSLLGGVFSFFIVFILTLYILGNPKPLVRGMIGALAPPYRKTALRVLIRSSRQVQLWVRATFWLMLIVGVMSGVGLWALGVKSPLLFGIIAGIGEAIPTIGPILSSLPPFLVTLSEDPTKSVWVLALFLVVQQLENNLLVPRIMASNLNLHAVSVMFFVIVMGTLMGPVGILLATPLCATAKVVYQEVYRRHILKA